MKANFRKGIRTAIVAVIVSGLAASCSDRRIVPAPQPAPPPASTTAPPPRPAADWRDAPITPGDWTWSMEGSRSVARFAGGALVLACDRANQTVTLSRPGAAPGPVAMSIQTSALMQPLTGKPQTGSPPMIVIAFAARDRALDAMAFSRGRFVVETAGLPTLYVPSWPEVTRVIEDCR